MVELLLPMEVLLIVVALTGIQAQIDVCGQAPLNNRIVGGEDANPGSWPWQISLHFRNSHFCGASLINEEWALSAAHCFPRSIMSNQRDLTVYIGRDTQQLNNDDEVSRTVAQIINHPDYSADRSDNDIALLRLSSPVTFTDYIRPVCLAGAGSTFGAGVITWVTGWGTMNVGEPLDFPQRLQEVDVPIVSNADCNDVYGIITSNMLCAGLSQGGKDSCQGDSGGPMVVKNGTLWIECGVVSFGRGCADAGFPGVYARVSQYESWIKSHITTNQPGFISVRLESSSSVARVSQFLGLALPLLAFLL
ncbi:unnamed protein product [Ophioblennius macclurei]